MAVKEIFDTYAENAFDISEKENILQWKRGYCNANYKKFFPTNKEAKILDIGPGLGEMLLVEKEWGYKNVYAIDISPSVIRYCQKLGLDCEQVKDTAEWLKNHPDTYDVITLLDVFEHVPKDDTVAFLEACKGALRDDGVFILQVPNIQSPDSFLHRYNDVTHVFGYSQHTLEQLFSVVGFETIQFYPFEEYPDTDRDTKVTRRLRSIYWKIVNVNREITHNLQPEILTPEIFAVLSKSKLDLPEHKLENEFDDGVITIADIRNYLDKIGVKAELIQTVEKVATEVLELEQRLNNKGDEWLELEQRLNDKSNEWNKKWEALLDEQNGRLVNVVDEKEQRLDEHNEWTRNRLDILEKQVEELRSENEKLKDTMRMGEEQNQQLREIVSNQEEKLDKLRKLLPIRFWCKLQRDR